MAVRITEACSTLIIAAVAPSAALLVAIVDQLARVTILSTICKVEEVMFPAALIISPIVPPTVSPISVNS
mgnify:CR=1 FL=1